MFKDKALIAGLIVVTLVAMCYLAAHGKSAPLLSAPKSIDRWEYKVVPLDKEDLVESSRQGGAAGDNFDAARRMEARLDAEGKEGWEFVETRGEICLVFKRRF